MVRYERVRRVRKGEGGDVMTDSLSKSSASSSASSLLSRLPPPSVGVWAPPGWVAAWSKLLHDFSDLGGAISTVLVACRCSCRREGGRPGPAYVAVAVCEVSIRPSGGVVVVLLGSHAVLFGQASTRTTSPYRRLLGRAAKELRARH
jgi:hypothetical protein